ncbi:MAG: SPOR domain-containing protein [Pseudomonadota bacterium]
MKFSRKFLYGALGGIVPFGATLAIADHKTILLGMTAMVLLGALLRGVSAMFIGGIWAAIHDESRPKRLVELGILAPFVVAAFINSANGEALNLPEPPMANPVSAIFSITDAYAQNSDEGERALKQFSMPQESISQQVWRGFTFQSPNNVWFVIAGSFKLPEDAGWAARVINKKFKDFNAQVYEPYGDSEYYSVVIGSNLTRGEAEKLRQQATDAGVAKDAYLWTFPKKD